MVNLHLLSKFQFLFLVKLFEEFRICLVIYMLQKIFLQNTSF